MLVIETRLPDSSSLLPTQRPASPRDVGRGAAPSRADVQEDTCRLTPTGRSAATEQPPRPAPHPAPAQVAPDRRPSSSRSVVRLRALDGLRLGVALMVAAFHFLGTHEADPVWGQDAIAVFPTLGSLAQYGWLGVEIFFVISGFVICMSSWGRSVGSFFRSRVCRLYPAYWAAVCLTYVVITMAPVLTSPERVPTMADAIANLTMLQQPMGATLVDSVYWTLWVEMRFYLLFALVMVTGLTYRKVMIFAGIWTVVTPVARVSGSDWFKIVTIYDFSSWFLVGIGLYLIHRFGHQFLTWALIAVNLAVSLYRMQVRIDSHLDNAAVDQMHFGLAALLVLGAVGLILAIALGKLEWMNWSWLTWAGALTYPFYLLHQMIGYTLIHHLFVRREVSAYAVLPLAFGVTLLLAWAVHRTVERPLSHYLKVKLSDGSLLDPREEVPAR